LLESNCHIDGHLVRARDLTSAINLR